MSDLSDDSLHALARTHFSILALTEAQLEAVKRAVKGESVFVFTPTASGKTMCFYLVPFVLKKLKPDECFRVIIISPLIALMKDQVAFLSEKGHPAVYLCGENKASVLPSLQEKKDLFLFLTPEQAIATDVKAVLAQKKNPCCLLVVDEAHCVLEGRPEYRPEYMHLTRLLHTLNAPIMALTATPTDTVRCNLPISLGIGKYTVIEGILDRPELFLEVRTVNGLQNLDANLLKEIAQQPELTVIFCQEKNKVCDLYKQAKQVMGRRVGVYHASLSKDQKVLVIGRVMGGELQALFTTSALGMGVNIPGLKWVILYGAPINPLDLAQMMGRACRNKQSSGRGTLIVSNRAVPKPPSTPRSTPKPPASARSTAPTQKKSSARSTAPTQRSLTFTFNLNSARNNVSPPSASRSPVTPATPKLSPPSSSSGSSSSPSPRSVMVFAQATPRQQEPARSVTVKEMDSTSAEKIPVDVAADKQLVELFAFEPSCKRRLLLG